ncbi:hypothetical protein [Salinibaculum rarum]|uniref:hypothetical protein n=1 Tax=Salinibaculum rarum TaxID=3058903 RepID=UPI002660495B|nr:hypothetical protein [Salinibaculum sp. KK48]
MTSTKPLLNNLTGIDTEQLFTVLGDEDQAPGSRIEAAQHAIDNTDVSLYEVLCGYAIEKLGRTGVLLDVDDRDTLHTLADATPTNVTITADAIINDVQRDSRESVFQVARHIYEHDSLSQNEKQTEIEELIQNAKQSGVDIKEVDVKNALSDTTDGTASETTNDTDSSSKDETTTNEEQTESESEKSAGNTTGEDDDDVGTRTEKSEEDEQASDSPSGHDDTLTLDPEFCQWVSDDGEQCHRQTEPGEQYCWEHPLEDSKNGSETSGDSENGNNPVDAEPEVTEDSNQAHVEGNDISESENNLSDSSAEEQSEADESPGESESDENTAEDSEANSAQSESEVESTESGGDEMEWGAKRENRDRGGDETSEEDSLNSKESQNGEPTESKKSGEDSQVAEGTGQHSGEGRNSDSGIDEQLNAQPDDTAETEAAGKKSSSEDQDVPESVSDDDNTHTDERKRDTNADTVEEETPSTEQETGDKSGSGGHDVDVDEDQADTQNDSSADSEQGTEAALVSDAVTSSTEVGANEADTSNQEVEQSTTSNSGSEIPGSSSTDGRAKSAASDDRDGERASGEGNLSGLEKIEHYFVDDRSTWITYVVKRVDSTVVQSHSEISTPQRAQSDQSLSSAGGTATEQPNGNAAPAVQERDDSLSNTPSGEQSNSSDEPQTAGTSGGEWEDTDNTANASTASPPPSSTPASSGSDSGRPETSMPEVSEPESGGSDGSIEDFGEELAEDVEQMEDSGDEGDNDESVAVGGPDTQGESDEETDELRRNAPGPEHTQEGRHAEEYDPSSGGVTSMPNYVQELVDIEFVYDADDEYMPDGVNAEGVIVVDDKHFAAIARVEPRSWSIHTEEKKSQIIQGFQSSFLGSLDFPVQIVSYPTKFDITDHITKLERVLGAGNTRAGDSQLVNMGRQIYPNWLETFMTKNDMQQRDFYIIVPVRADQIQQFEDEGFLDNFRDTPGIGALVSKFTDDPSESVTKVQCIRELKTRMSRIESGLRRIDVQVERIDDRDEVMSVLYHYYNNYQPMKQVFPTGPFSMYDEQAEIGIEGFDLDALTDNQYDSGSVDIPDGGEE